MIVVMIQSTGMFLALGDITGRRLVPSDITRGLRALGVGTVLGGVFNTFPVTAFSQNIGLVGITGVYSRWVAATGEAKFHERRDYLYIGGIALGTGLIPLVPPEFFKNFPPTTQSFLGSGIFLATIVAVLLNAYFNGVSLPTTQPRQLTSVASGAGR
jgi:uric acid transporter